MIILDGNKIFSFNENKKIKSELNIFLNYRQKVELLTEVTAFK